MPNIIRNWKINEVGAFHLVASICLSFVAVNGSFVIVTNYSKIHGLLINANISTTPPPPMTTTSMKMLMAIEIVQNCREKQREREKEQVELSNFPLLPTQFPNDIIYLIGLPALASNREMNIRIRSHQPNKFWLMACVHFFYHQSNISAEKKPRRKKREIIGLRFLNLFFFICGFLAQFSVNNFHTMNCDWMPHAKPFHRPILHLNK